MSWRRIGWLLLAGAACLAATALNPIGSDIFGYVVKLLTDPPSQGLVNEWQPPTTRSLAGAMFFAALVILLAALALGRRRPTLTETLLLCGFLWLALTGMRYVVWFGMLAMPILAQCLSRSPADIAHQRPADRSEGLFALILALALAGGVLILQPPLKAALPLPPAYKTFFAPVPGGAELFSLDTPAAAAAYLRANPAPGKLWNDMAYGSYLIWAAPEIQVFADPRVELFPLPQWQDYLAIAEARDYRRLLVDTYDVRRVLLDREVQPKLAAALAADPDWEREYSDARAEIYRRIR